MIAFDALEVHFFHSFSSLAPHCFVCQLALISLCSFSPHLDPPTVTIETSSLDYLEEEKDPATLRCISDSNPPSTILWRKEGLNGIFSPDEEINFSPVTRHTAGIYSCTAENALGMSKPAFVDLDVKCKFIIMHPQPSDVCCLAERHNLSLPHSLILSFFFLINRCSLDPFGRALSHCGGSDEKEDHVDLRGGRESRAPLPVASKDADARSAHQGLREDPRH